MQVVLDTSVIVAGTRSNAGASHQLLKAALERQFVMLLSVPLTTDANDDMVLEVALNGRADMLVTFNRKDFEPVASSLAIDVVAPQTALQQIRRKDEEE